MKRSGLIRGILLAFGETAVVICIWLTALAWLYIGAGFGN